MIPGTEALLAGGCTGTGLALAIRGLIPSHPNLASALQRLHAPGTRGSSAVDSALDATTWRGRAQLVAWLDSRAPTAWLRVSPQDLAVLGSTREKLLLQKLFCGLLGLALPVLTLTLVSLVGFHLGFALPAFVTLAIGVGMSLLPDLAIRGQAADARGEFKRAVGAYFDLVALERAAEGGPVDALTRAASVAQGWVFTRIADTLTDARVHGVAPWHALAGLAEEIGVTELTDLADVITLAGNDGAAIYDTLLAKARSIRTAALAATQATANSRSETMTLPAALLGIGFVILVGYPALARILAGS